MHFELHLDVSEFVSAWIPFFQPKMFIDMRQYPRYTEFLSLQIETTAALIYSQLYLSFCA